MQTFAEARIEELVLARKALFTDLIQLYRNALRTAGFAHYREVIKHAIDAIEAIDAIDAIIK